MAGGVAWRLCEARRTKSGGRLMRTLATFIVRVPARVRNWAVEGWTLDVSEHSKHCSCSGMSSCHHRQTVVRGALFS